MVIVTVLVLWKELLYSTFDPLGAAAAGLSVGALDYLFLGLIAVTIVVSLQAVGIILVVAMLVTPPATAQLLTLRFTRLVLLAAAALLTAAAVAAIGVVAFVGLVAPHAARALVGARHVRVLPMAALLGALLVGLGDVVGRTVIAPAQLPAGLLAALIGTPYFVYLLWRSRARTL